MEGSASQAGFYYQNNVAALKIIECLFFNSDIKFIRLENYAKGHHIDDVIIYRKEKIEYHQIKWSDNEDSSYTLYNLLTAQDPKKSIFKQLAEGYLNVKPLNVDFSITLFTTKRESSQKRPSEGLNHSITEIRKNIFEPLKETSVRYDQIPNYPEYADTLKIIRNECSLDEIDFDDFIKKLEFRFDQEPLDQIRVAVIFRLEKLGIEATLFERLLDGVVNWSITGEQITKLTVLKQLGISDRFEDKISHHFKVVDEKFYVSNTDLLQRINIAITELNGGYIFIEGLPGVGKSTALTKFKELNPEITLAYYCFIPDAKSEFGQLRHKSYYFLKSLCISIENQFPDIDFPNKYSEKFEEKLVAYIDRLSSQKKKVIFIIDGLDHVHRNTTLKEDSLLHHIKGDLPQGIFFILSSQYKGVLSSHVLAQIESDLRRHIVVNKFTQQEIKQYFDNKGIETKTSLDLIEKVSEGIPLYLHYISELLLQKEHDKHEEILRDFPHLIDGKIDSYHEHLFQKIENDEFSKWVLAVFANRKENSTPETVSEILALAGESNSITKVYSVISNFSHLLRHKDGRSYSIFHNSFREYILSKTTSLKNKFNSALISFYEANPNSDEAYRNYFQHLDEAEEYQKITSTTSLDWIKSAWRNHRSIDEIRSNLDIALNACVESVSLSEFIRIAFLKAQFERAAWNLENSEIDFPVFLLNAGETANSLRSIWDGDFVLTNKEYFCYYLGKYYSKTGTLLPQQIIKQGFSKPLHEGDSEKVTIIAKSEALVSENLNSIFEKIDSIKWVKSNNYQIGYHKENFSETENARTNLRIKLKVIDYLYDHKKAKELVSLCKVPDLNSRLLTRCKLALCKLLLQGDKKSAIKLLGEIELSTIPNKSYFKLIAYCSDYMTNSEIFQTFPKRTITLPTIHEKVVQQQRSNYTIHKDIVDLFETLKPIWIFNPEMVSSFALKISTLPSPTKNIYESILYLSELWNKDRTTDETEIAKTNLAKQALKSLYVPLSKETRKTHLGLFDHNGDQFFIASSIKKLFNPIFTLSTRILSKESIEEVINYWFSLEESSDGYQHHTVALGIAKEIYNSRHRELCDQIHKCIMHAEKLVRYEEETGTLTSYIAEVSEVYGICGFRDDFNRLYDQLIEIAFGLNYKKDYQSSYIITPISLLHDQEPEGTLKRLYEAFSVQNQLSNVGRSRMHHICLSELIAFVAKYYPGLAFLLLEKEEDNLWREEAMSMILEPVIKKATKTELPLLLSIVKTLPRWDKGGSRENFFLDLSLQLLKRAISLNDTPFIIHLLEVVKQNTLIELEEIDELKKFSEAFVAAGVEYTKYDLPEPSPKEEIATKRTIATPHKKFNIKYQEISLPNLISLFENEYFKFEEFLQSQYEICLKNKRNETFRNEFHRSKSTFAKFFNNLAEPDQFLCRKNLRMVIRNYITFKTAVLEFSPTALLSSADLENLFDDFLSRINLLLGNNTFQTFIETEFDKEKWLDSVLQFINGFRDNLLFEIIEENSVFELIEQVSILNIDNLLSFINKWTTGRTNVTASMKVATRLVHLDSSKARQIFTSIADDENDNLLFPRRYERESIDNNLVISFIESDIAFGKKFLLKNYMSQKGRYADDLIASMDKLLQYRNFFGEEGVLRIFYNANLQYNHELAKGLPEKGERFEYISNHIENKTFAEISFRYLVKYVNHPVVKVRELTIQSIFDLISFDEEHLDNLFKYGIEAASDNQLEHCLIVVQALALRKPKLLIPFKRELLRIANIEHFNVAECIKNILLNINSSVSSFLSTDEITILHALNRPSPIIYERGLVNTQRGQQFIFSKHQSDLLRLLYSNEDDEVDIQDDVFTDLCSKGFKGYNIEQESAVHRQHNINTNYDTIEIQSPYYDEVKSSINRIFYSKIRRGCFVKEFIEETKAAFRLYDPSKLLYKVRQKPQDINWLIKKDSPEDFIEFKDLDIAIETFVNRKPNYITLIEFGSQRNEDRFDELQATSYFEIFAFLKKKEFELRFSEGKKAKWIPWIMENNIYATELPSKEFVSSSYPIIDIKPLLQISHNKFRGESDLINGNLLYDLFMELGLEPRNLLEVLISDCCDPLNAFRWQTAYSSGRRRYKPTSEGFILEIDKDVFSKYLAKNDWQLCYDVKLKRSTTKHRPEEYMEWHSIHKQIEVGQNLV